MKFQKLIASILFTLCVSFTYAYSQCVQCKPSQLSPGALSCQSSTSGGNECSPSSKGQSCLIAGACPFRGGDPPVEGGDSLTSMSNNCTKEKKVNVEIDSSIIKAIGDRHPRFAIALAEAQSSGFLGLSNIKFTMMPIQITQETYSTLLEQAFAKQFSEKTLIDSFSQKTDIVTNTKGLKLVEYSIDIISKKDTNGKIIRLKVNDRHPDDPDFTTVELPLTEVENSDTSLKADKKWKVSGWELK